MVRWLVDIVNLIHILGELSFGWILYNIRFRLQRQVFTLVWIETNGRSCFYKATNFYSEMWYKLYKWKELLDKSNITKPWKETFENCNFLRGHSICVVKLEGWSAGGSKLSCLRSPTPSVFSTLHITGNLKNIC